MVLDETGKNNDPSSATNRLWQKGKNLIINSYPEPAQ